MRRQTTFIKPILTLLLLAAPLLAKAAEPAAVPAKFQPLYRELDAALAQTEQDLKQHPSAPGAPKPLFTLELLGANSNRGEGLLEPRSLPGAILTMRRIKELGAGAISLSIQYPFLMDETPHAAEYKEFYRRVVAEARALDLKVVAEMGTFFPQPEFSQFRADYAGLTLDKFAQGLATMGGWIARELKPDYLTILSEPDTSARNAGLTISPADLLKIVNTVLPAVRQPGVRVGAGTGSWSPPAYLTVLARQTKLDYIDLHVYPVQRGFMLERIRQAGALARETGKGLTVGESWLYKVGADELGSNIAGAPQAFARDAWSFWAPLDARFVRCMMGLARREKMEFCSFFWMRYLYGYVEHRPEYERLAPGAIYALANRAAGARILTNQPSEAGEAFRAAARE